MTLTYYFIVKGIILLPLSIAYPIILSAPVLLSIMGIIIFYLSYIGAKNRGTLLNMGE